MGKEKKREKEGGVKKGRERKKNMALKGEQQGKNKAKAADTNRREITATTNKTNFAPNPTLNVKN